MIEYIKKNPIFLSMLCLLTITIGLLTGQAFFVPDEPTIIEPPVIDKPEPSTPEDPIVVNKKAEIKNFTGSFNETSNMIQLNWELAENNSVVQHVDLYVQGILVAEVTDLNRYDVPISFYEIATGSNAFELQMSIESETKPLSYPISVSVPYIFNSSTKNVFVDNNLGKGLLLTLTYKSNERTPVGIPTIQVKTDATALVDVRLINTNSESMGFGYSKNTVVYFVDLSNYALQNTTWTIDYSFASVGIDIDDIVVADLSNVEFITDNMFEEQKPPVEEETEEKKDEQ